MTRGVSYENMVPSRRCGYIRSLREFHADFLVCRDVEAECHASSVTEDEYCERMRHAAFNLRQNPAIGAKVVHATENELTQGTIVGKSVQKPRHVRSGLVKCFKKSTTR